MSFEPTPDKSSGLPDILDRLEESRVLGRYQRFRHDQRRRVKEGC
jgi:hypothetical protein